MSSLGWLDVTNIDFNALLRLEPLHVRCLAQRKPSAAMGTALAAHPAVSWYLTQTYPPVKPFVEGCLQLASEHPSPEELREAEIAVLDSMHDWLIYVLDPAKYDQLKFLRWEDASLLGMADFKDKIVLDIGSGTGRLAFTVAPEARVVYAVEPVANLRRFLWEKRSQLGVDNVYPIDGTMERIPFPIDFADILMSGHVFGDNCDAQYQEMVRAVKDGGLILLHPGTNAQSIDPAHQYLIEKGFRFDTFTEPGDGLKRKYWKTIHKYDKESNARAKRI
jgi:ubiquinone/menaquinone biosynthesis C-methylase UbiE